MSEPEGRHKALKKLPFLSSSFLLGLFLRFLASSFLLSFFLRFLASSFLLSFLLGFLLRSFLASGLLTRRLFLGGAFLGYFAPHSLALGARLLA